LTNQRGIRRNPKVYAFETEEGEKMPRFERLSSYVNADAIDRFKRSQMYDLDNFRRTQSTYM